MNKGYATKYRILIIDAHIKDLGYQRISIGVGTTDMANIRLYEHPHL